MCDKNPSGKPASLDRMSLIRGDIGRLKSWNPKYSTAAAHDSIALVRSGATPAKQGFRFAAYTRSKAAIATKSSSEQAQFSLR